MAAGGGRVMNWEIGIDIYTLICIKWMTNKNLLYKKINKIQKKIHGVFSDKLEHVMGYFIQIDLFNVC